MLCDTGPLIALVDEEDPGDSQAYDAYLFDLDGVLVDTLDWIRGAYRCSAERFGFTASDEALSDLYGRPLAACYEALHAAGEPEALIACHREFQRGHMDLQRLFPGAVELLDGLRARGSRTALISSRSGPSLRQTLQLFGLEGRFDRIVWPEECAAHKPDPEPVLIALRDLGAAPSRALVIGDTPNDIRAGQAAGVDTAGATYGFLGGDVALASPTHLVQTVLQVADLSPAASLQHAGEPI